MTIMEFICGGDHIVSASVLGYPATKIISVSGEASVGSRVRPGPDWSGGTAVGEGTVSSIQTQSSTAKYCYGARSWREVFVTWDNGTSGGPYRWGAWNTDTYMQYHIDLVPTRD